MALARIGLLTGALEALATVVGAGILLGGFVAGATRFLAGRPRRILEERVLTDGYLGGIVSLWLALVDAAVRYGG